MSYELNQLKHWLIHLRLENVGNNWNLVVDLHTSVTLTPNRPTVSYKSNKLSTLMYTQYTLYTHV